MYRVVIVSEGEIPHFIIKKRYRFLFFWYLWAEYEEVEYGKFGINYFVRQFSTAEDAENYIKTLNE